MRTKIKPGLPVGSFDLGQGHSNMGKINVKDDLRSCVCEEYVCDDAVWVFVCVCDDAVCVCL